MAVSKTRRDSNASSGVVLNMDMVSVSYYAVTYTVPVRLGASQQNFSLQVDTGSSDLWIASKSCSSAACSGTNGRLYDPGPSQSTGANFSMQYLSGTVDGPIVRDQFQLGGYVIPDQALAAATFVNDEPLSYDFDGILGLGLPSASGILQALPTGTGDAPGGATFSSNLFSLDPAPSPFFSLTLARPGSDQTSSLLGIGSHPPEIVSDPSQIQYSRLVEENDEEFFWKTLVRAITVYVDGQAHSVALQSRSGAPGPTALLDSGSPLIVTTPALANGIYGALGIGPASDGNYYVPCTTPLNMSITLDGQEEFPLHPLDLTVEPAGQSTAQYCIGLIQTDPSLLTASSSIGDMILGVPFMRNVYTVLAYGQPNATGNVDAGQSGPMLGLLGLTNATLGLQEFDRVRGLQPPGASAQSLGTQNVPKLAVGIQVLIGLVGFLMLSVALFALRCALARRRWPRAADREECESNPETKMDGVADEEFGVRGDVYDPWDPHAGTWRDTIIGTDAGESASLASSFVRDAPWSLKRLSEHDEAWDGAEFGVVYGMTGIGTAARGGVTDAGLQRLDSHDSARSSLPLCSSCAVVDVDRTL